MNNDGDNEDLEAIQAHMQMTMALLYDAVDASMKNSTLPNEYGVESLTDFKPRPPRLGVGAVPSAKTEASTSLGRETARLHGRLAGKKRGRDTLDTEEQPAALTNGIKRLKVDEASSEEESRAATISRTKPGDKFSITSKANPKVDKFAMPKPKKSKKQKRDETGGQRNQTESATNPTTKDATRPEDSLPNGQPQGNTKKSAFKTPELPDKAKETTTLFNASFSEKHDKGSSQTHTEASLKSGETRHSPLSSRSHLSKRESSTDAYIHSTGSSGLRSNSILSMSSSSSRRSSASRRLLKRELLYNPQFIPRIIPLNQRPTLTSHSPSASHGMTKEKTEAISKPLLQLEPLPEPSTQSVSGEVTAEKKKKRRKKKKKKHADDQTRLVTVDEEED
ncbi:hypothetical protein PIIN_08015 [Serendipita indica DSM 11827]|uniref:Uncharacterized protein n=1 Tax=Serendipita indica (strain DSM 11827) TaxID=1109443 RepID=G4TRW8_SERID|nr:hypothetical protein PIIN_08015 [Serendipita indica DSM 11827]